MPKRKRYCPTWTRTGCVTCKKRQKKCDEKRPRCGNCTRLDLFCEPFDAFQPFRPRGASEKRRFHFTDGRPKRIENLWPVQTDTTSDGQAFPPSGHYSDNYSSVSAVQACQRRQSDLNTSVNAAPTTSTDGSDRQSSSGSTLSSSTTGDAEHFLDQVADDGCVFEDSVLQDFATEGIGHASFVNSTSTIGPGPLSMPPQVSEIDRIAQYPTISGLQIYLIQHYFERLAPILINVDGPENPLKNVLIPRALVSPLLLHAVCAVSACHLSNTFSNGDNGMQSTALSIYTQTLQEFTQSLNDTDNRLFNSDSADILALTATFICKYQIMNGGLSQWRPLLVGLQQLSRSMTRLAQETKDFVHSFLTYHANMADIMGLVSSPDSSTYATLAVIIPPWTSIRKVDPYMGLSERFISCLAQVSDLFRVEVTQREDFQKMLSESGKIIRSISDDLQDVEESECLKKLDPETLGGVQKIASAYRKGVFIWSHSVLEHLTNPDIARLSVYQKDVAKGQIPMTKESAVTSCLEDLTAVPRGHPCEAALTFLLFLTGCETEKSDEFDIIYDRLQSLDKNLHIGNVQQALIFLDKVYANKNRPGGVQHWQSLWKEMGWDLILS